MCREHSKSDLFKCALCGDKSDYNNSINRHLRAQHQIMNPADQKKNTIFNIMYTTLEEQPSGPQGQGQIGVTIHYKKGKVKYLFYI
jgi:hypothetical protein